MQFLKTPNFNFFKYYKIFFGVSILGALVTVASLVIHKGPNWSIDFTGGTLIQGFFQKSVPLEDIRKALSDAGLSGGELQSSPNHNAVIIRYKTAVAGATKEELGTRVTDALAKAFSDNRFEMERVEFVGPVIGRYLVRRAFLAILFSLLGIVAYVAIRFKNWIWGASGVIALAHDVFLTVGFLSVFNREVSITVIAALLTLAGYSINDTIVIFDRIRENLRMRRKEPLDVVINRSLNETLSRTIITSLTVFLVLLSLLFFGGEVIHDFALALTFGVIVGSYSTLFIATPMIYFWQMRQQRALQSARR